MNPHLMNLINLQDIMGEVFDARKKMEKMPERYADLEQSLRETKQRVEDAESDLADAKALRQQKQNAIDDNEQKLKENKQRQFDVKTPREFEAISAENSFLIETNASLEDEMIELMEKIEELQATIEEGTKAITEEEKTIEADLKRLKREESGLKKEIKKHRERAVEIEESLPKAFISLFNRIAERRDGSAVVECADGICSGCQMKSRLQVWTEIARNDSIIQCFNCQRILYKNTETIEEKRIHRAEPVG